ncbi:hypothetical protein HBO15_23600 [Pseudomonas sp. WS 5111]|uniref:hypothetical protein n=1 Tax=unclassified Pseudomonas TaxID=196821 RepID=UPI0014736B96|nr:MULTISPECIES: hypothetical protein [unclassified Pseudomonas]NMX70347.1 hypothetical protein [Pseudomonas sp. WS 5111]NMX84439.1 hypothetical protein [Pseudomonas sp. WS 5010]
MFFAPLFCSLAPTAGRIVVLIGLFFNRHGFDVGVCPLVQLVAVKASGLFSNGEFTDVRADGVFENLSAQPRYAGAAEARMKRGAVSSTVASFVLAIEIPRQAVAGWCCCEWLGVELGGGSAVQIAGARVHRELKTG